MASNPTYSDITPEVEMLAKLALSNSTIDPEDYTRYNVKRGLRDLNGKGVLAGLTEIADVHASETLPDGTTVPCDGELYYRGYNVRDLVKGFVDDHRLGFEETAYLLMFGQLPNAQQLHDFDAQLCLYRSLPSNFVRDVILKAPNKDIMNALARSILTLASYDDNPDDISLPNVVRQCIQLIAVFPMLAVYSYQAYSYSVEGKSLFIQRPTPTSPQPRTSCICCAPTRPTLRWRRCCWTCVWCCTPSTAAATTPPSPPMWPPAPAPIPIPAWRPRWPA